MPLQISVETLTPSEVVQQVVTNFATTILEGATATYVLALQVSGGGTLDNTELSSATLTLYDEETKSVINSRSSQDILGAPANIGDNNVVISIASQFTWSMQAADNAYVDPTKTKRVEYHRAIFTISYDSGSGAEVLIHEVRFAVKRGFSPE